MLTQVGTSVICWYCIYYNSRTKSELRVISNEMTSKGKKRGDNEWSDWVSSINRDELAKLSNHLICSLVHSRAYKVE